ncbi:cyclic peptide export ABC transporter [Alkalinema sp. FACHB-956]|uniref:cyclic peptide export ABC transporter n=1 Tax=Alkalinema sp. FACHB-956 TaxID=2692768 RepID=UPI001687742C|nr:cyclic peptide export ABC transporter [Alkalinema sp. FACHB-956]MBD2327233.1 cyclic peptide export ABC transporter [Alkalinema sp. FACHB-956]
MNILWLLLKASWQNVTIAILTGLISGGCSAQLIALINQAIAGKSVSIGLFIVLTLLSLLTTVMAQFLLIRLAQTSIYRLRLRLSHAILTTPLSQLEALGPSKLLAALTEDVQTIANTVFAIPFLCVDISIIVSCMIYLGFISIPVFLGLLVFMALSIVSVQYFLGRARKYLKLARAEDDFLFKHFRTLTDGIKELKLSYERRRSFIKQDLEASALNSKRYNVQALTLFSLATGWGNLLFFMIIGMVLFALPKLINIPSNTLAAFILTLTFLMLPFRNLLERLPLLFKANVALQKVEYMGLTLESNKEIPVARDTFVPTRQLAPQEIQLDHIVHTYRTDRDEEPFRLTIPDLTIPAGQMVFIVGGNGSGKSTLAKLLVGLYRAETGAVKYGGATITPETLSAYRENFSVVFADFHLFERVVGQESHDLDRQAQDYLEKLQIAHKVQVQDGLLSTTALSTGQRKRLALLHAYLDDRPVYLFDEWASDQDPVFRDLFYNHILFDLKQRGKTVLVISHDDRYFHLGDRIIKLDYGQIEYDKAL